MRAKLEEKAQAQAFANALATIGKFAIKKKAGDKDQIFGSVTPAEVVEAIYQQTGRCGRPPLRTLLSTFFFAGRGAACPRGRTPSRAPPLHPPRPAPPCAGRSRRRT